MNSSRPSRLRILCAEPENYSRLALERMSTFGDVEARTMAQAEFDAEASNFDVLMIRLRLMLSERTFVNPERAPLAVLSPTTGVNHLALGLTGRLGIQVFHLRGERAFLDTIHSTAEHSFLLMLALHRKLLPAALSVRSGRWEQTPFRGRELGGKRLGIVGLGRLGSLMARYADSFGMRVAAFDPYLETFPAYVRRYTSLEELFGNSDVVSLHAPLDDTTRGLVGTEQLACLPDGALFVNTARGELVDELALLEALRSGKLAAAAVDVLSDEHRSVTVGSALLDYAKTADNLLVTPHIGGAALEAIERTDNFIIDKFERWLHSRGKDL